MLGIDNTPLQPGVKRPPVTRQLLEARWPLEAAGFAITQIPWSLVGEGDGHPVLVLPGFVAGDDSTAPLRRVLRSQGYMVRGWKLGRNMGPTSRVVLGMRRRLEQAYRASGNQPVSIIGWSLGGIYARTLARESPEMVRQVITLGSPFRMTENDRSTATALWDRVKKFHSDELPLLGTNEETKPPLTVPTTAIYTKEDGVVRWQLCIDDTGNAAPNPRSENVRVYATHVGLGFNPSVIYVIMNRLSQPEDDWQPFRSPLAYRLWYPKSEAWMPQ